MKVKTIKRVNISSEIANQIQYKIQNGELKIGEKLPPERVLCEKFDVSRTSIREAVSGLIAKSFLERRKSGTYVCELNRDTVKDSMNLLISSKQISIGYVIEARFILEVENAGLAALRATEEDIQNMEQCIVNSENLSSHENDLLHKSADFHVFVAHATHNPVLKDFFMVLNDILIEDQRSIKKVSTSSKGHIDILERIRAKDVAGAKMAMCNHLQTVDDTYIKNSD